MEKTLIVLVHYATRSGLAKDFVGEVLSLGVLDAIRQEDGCIKYDYYLSSENPSEVLLEERWTSEEKQLLHLEGAAMKKLKEAKEKFVVSQTVEKFYK